MYKYRITTIKDSTVQWYQKDPEIQAHLDEVYINTGLMSLTTVVNETSNSMDMLIKEVTFLDEESFLKFKADPIVSSYIAGRKVYETNNTIIRIKENIS